MKDFVKSLLSMGITVGLSDRETFVKQVSSVIQQYQDDPEKAEKWTNAMVAYLEKVGDNINLQNAIKGAMEGSGVADKSSMEDLTKAIQQLTEELKKKDKG